MGVVAGAWSFFLIVFALSQGLGSVTISSPWQIFVILEFLLLIFVAPIFVFVGGLVLITIEINQSRRGILGFLVFVTAVVILLFCSIITNALLVHTPF
jgi:hypothetical protein